MDDEEFTKYVNSVDYDLEETYAYIENVMDAKGTFYTCFSDEEIIEDFLTVKVYGSLKIYAPLTVEDAIKRAREFCGLHEEQRTNVLQPDISKEEWKQAVENAKFLKGQ